MSNKLDIINAASAAFGNINYIGDNNIVTNECDMEAGFIKDYFVKKNLWR